MDGYHWYGAEGDAGNAGLSCAAMVPLAGSAATATKWGIKYGDEVVALSDDAVAKIDEAVGAACSFSGDTTVATPDGEKAISELEVGDTVLAWDEETGQLGSFEVTATFSHEDTVIEYLVIDGERLVTTPEHPFYTRERGWVAAGDLKKGEHVRKADGTWGVVESMRLVEREQRMYNLTVDEAHTYFVGDVRWLVHNVCALIDIVPYSQGKNLTKGRGGDIQAHHILEARHLRNWGEDDLAAPSVVLSRTDHQELNRRLAEELSTGRSYSREEVWERYQEVYADHPELLDAIRGYFE